MAVLADIQGIAVVGAQAQIGGVAFGQKADERMQIFRNRALADQHPHPLAQLFQTLLIGGRLVFGADTGGDIAVQIVPAQQGGMAVDMAAGKSLQLFHAAGVLMQNARIIHEFRQPDHARMIHQRDQIRRLQPRARRLHMGRGHAGR